MSDVLSHIGKILGNVRTGMISQVDGHNFTSGRTRFHDIPNQIMETILYYYYIYIDCALCGGKAGTSQISFRKRFKKAVCCFLYRRHIFGFVQIKMKIFICFHPFKISKKYAH
jgi:hypothetical protein